MSPIEPNTSSIAATAAFGETLGGGSSRATRSARSRVRISPVLHPAVLLAFADGAAFEQHLADPSIVRKAIRFSFIISMQRGKTPSRPFRVPGW